MRLFPLFRPNTTIPNLPGRAEKAVLAETPRRSGSQCQHLRGSSLWKASIPLLAPIAFLLLATVFFRMTKADFQISAWAYGSSADPWPWAHTPLCDFIYDYGTLPGMVLGFGGLVVGLVSLAWHRLRPYRQAGFFLAAMLALGPGLMVNGILKPQWRRPRPCQTIEFGGKQSFVGVWGMGTSERSKSFPSGHASMGFLLMAPAFLLYRRHRRLAMRFVLLGLAAGMALGTTRILQGGHFLSDVLWAGGMVYLTGLALVSVLQLAALMIPASDKDSSQARLLTTPGSHAEPQPVARPPAVGRKTPSRRKAA